MKLYLGSCDLGTNQEELTKWIKNYGKDIVLIPNALDVIYDLSLKQDIINSDKQMLEDVGFNVKVESLKNYFGNYQNLKERFDNYKAFYTIGGNVFTLRKAMELSGFDTYLKGLSKQKDLLYGGYSAGICVLATNIDILELADEQRNPYNGDIFFKPGLGLIDYLPIPHYESPNQGRTMEEIVKYCKKYNVKYKTIKDGQSMIDDTMSLGLEM